MTEFEAGAPPRSQPREGVERRPVGPARREVATVGQGARRVDDAAASAALL